MLEEVIANGVEGNLSVRYNQLAYARLKLGQPREALGAAERAFAGCGDVASECISALRARAFRAQCAGRPGGGAH